MKISATATVAALTFQFSGFGISHEAQTIAALQQNYNEQTFQSESMRAGRKKILEELVTVFEECSEPNWDGYGAVPVSLDAYRAAFKFIEALPNVIPTFSVGATPDGHLTLEWYRSPRRVLSVSVSPEGDLHFASLIGMNKTSGSRPFVSVVPQIILDLISLTMNSNANRVAC